MKKFAFLLVLSIIIFSSTSCNRPQYLDNIACKELSEIAINVCDDGNEYVSYDEDYISFFLRDPSICNDFCIIYSVEAEDINEFGIFHAATDEYAAMILEEIEEYLRSMKEEQRAFISSYAPEELSKLDSAKASLLGRYVVYSISDSNTAKKTLSAIASALAGTIADNFLFIC